MSPAEAQPGDARSLLILDPSNGLDGSAVYIIRGRAGQQTPDRHFVQLLDEDDIAHARLTIAAPKMRSTLWALVQWARYTGGWDAPCWREAEGLLAEVAGAQAPTEEP